MHKLVVMSDSHGTEDAMVEVVERENPERVIFLGDGWDNTVALSTLFPLLPLIRVTGNCDFQAGERSEKLVELYGKRIFLCHGHTLSVKSTLSRFLYTARRYGADIALYGHTHRPHCSLEGGMWVMNPGSICRSERQHYGLILIEGEQVNCKICEF